jgi:hypothetical protein
MLEFTNRELYSNSSYLEYSKLVLCIKVFDNNIVLIKPIIEKALIKVASQLQARHISSKKDFETIKNDIIRDVYFRINEHKKSTQVSILEQEKLNHIDALLVRLSEITEL